MRTENRLNTQVRLKLVESLTAKIAECDRGDLSEMLCVTSLRALQTLA